MLVISMIGSFQGLAQERLLTWEKGIADNAVRQIFYCIFYGRENILSTFMS